MAQIVVGSDEIATNYQGWVTVPILGSRHLVIFLDPEDGSSQGTWQVVEGHRNEDNPGQDLVGWWSGDPASATRQSSDFQNVELLPNEPAGALWSQIQALAGDIDKQFPYFNYGTDGAGNFSYFVNSNSFVASILFHVGVQDVEQFLSSQGLIPGEVPTDALPNHPHRRVR